MFKCIIFTIVYSALVVYGGEREIITGSSNSSPVLQEDVPDQGNSGQDRSSKRKTFEFRRVGMGEMQDEVGTVLGFTTYQSSDGIGVMVLDKEFPSPALANNYLNRKIKRAKTVIERAASIRDSGTVIGQRARALIPTEDSKELANAIFWTVGPKFQQIISTSLRDALELEKQLKNREPQGRTGRFHEYDSNDIPFSTGP